MRSLYYLIFLFLLTVSCKQQEGMKPEETEVWEPEPEVVIPGEGTAPPSDAVVLIGENLDAWENSKGEKAEWMMEDGVATVKPGAGPIISKEKYGNIQLHVEWRSPEVVEESSGQGRGNSGIFLQSNYEVQVLDSYNNRTYSNGQAGSIYKQHIPLVNATRPPMEWQTYDIIYQAPEFENGELSQPAYITVIHNGILIQNHVEIKGETVYIGEPSYTEHGKLPLRLQDHGNLVSYRNIWLRELD